MTKLRAVIYARYSSDLQREASIEDQIEVCRRHIRSQGWSLAKSYTDAAVSGASRFRPSYQEMLKDAREGKFDIVVCEAIDRLGRRLADTADLQDTLAFLGIRLVTPSLGEVTTIHVAVMGMMAQIALRDLAEKTRRGQLGRVRRGKMAGGLAYGYVVLDAPNGERGHRAINPAEASIVRRIFEDYAAGKTPEQIARELNKDRILGPRSRAWSNTTIRGQHQRGTGILNNSIYIGVMEWNRCSYVKDPRTGRRVARPNRKDQWETIRVPELRIIDDELWRKVKLRQERIRNSVRGEAAIHAAERRNLLNESHRPRFLLSGLMKCSVCGGTYTISGRDVFRCATRRQKGTCTNSISVKRQDLEERVLRGLKEYLVTPDLLAIFVQELESEFARRHKAAKTERAQAATELQDIQRRIKAILDAVENGLYEPEMKERLKKLSDDRERLRNSLSQQTEKVLTFPNSHQLYIRKVKDLELSLAGAKGIEARELIRSMITKVEIKPGAPAERYEAILHGDLAAILRVCSQAQDPLTDQVRESLSTEQLSVVAGVGFEPTTFRL